MSEKNKTKFVGARVSLEEYELLKKTGYKPYEIIKMFLDKYYNTTPVGLAIELDSLKLELSEIPDKEIAIKHKINEIESKLSKFNEIDLISETAIIMIKVAISKYLNKSIQYHNISDFLDDIQNKELVDKQSYKLGYSINDYKKLVIDYYNRNYD